MGSTSKSESKLSTVDESGHKKGAGTHLNEIEVENKGSEDGIELSEACPVSLFHAEAGAEEAAETKQEQTDEEDVDGKQLGLDANKSDSSQVCTISSQVRPLHHPSYVLCIDEINEINAVCCRLTVCSNVSTAGAASARDARRPRAVRDCG